MEPYLKSIKCRTILPLSIVSLLACLSILVGRSGWCGAGQPAPAAHRALSPIAITLHGPSHFKAGDAYRTEYYIEFKNVGGGTILLSRYEVYLVIYDSQGKLVTDLRLERAAPGEKRSLPGLFDLVGLNEGDSHQIHRMVCSKFIGRPLPGNYFLECVIYHTPKSEFKSSIKPVAFFSANFPLIQVDLHGSPRLPIHLD